MRRAVRVQLTEAEARELGSWAQATATVSRRAQRARIVLMAAEGRTNQDIARVLSLHPETVSLWRRRFVSNRLEGIRMDAPRSGHRRNSARLKERIAKATRGGRNLSGKAWTTRALAKRFRVSHMTVHRAQHANSSSSVNSSAPLAERSTPHPREGVEIEGVFLDPPRRAAVFQLETPAGGTSPAPYLPARSDGTLAEDLGVGLSVLFRRWKRSASYRSGSHGSVAELLVFLRMVERQTTPSSSFIVLYEGFSRAAERRVTRWTQAHARFRPVRVPARTTWFKAFERFLGERAADPITTHPDLVLGPLTESLASYLRTDPAAPAPFVWTAPSLSSGASGPSRPL